MQELINLLLENRKTISTMESCTGGGIANAITNIAGVSEVFKYGAVTYSNEYKIKMGVDPKVIEKYTVYSIETAMEMSKNISIFANSDYGIGVTGQLNRQDKNNIVGDNNKIYISIYDKCNDKYHNYNIVANNNLNRLENKSVIIDLVVENLTSIIKNDIL
jgi:PncC family amidohydrolase